jgi:hypothetical protein
MMTHLRLAPDMPQQPVLPGFVELPSLSWRYRRCTQMMRRVLLDVVQSYDFVSSYIRFSLR